MGKKTIQTFDGGKHSAWFILSSANAYYSLSATITEKLPRTDEELSSAPPSIVDLAASATNRILALELYIKACLVMFRLAVPMVHDLKILYDALPEQTRQTFEQCFNERCNLMPPHEIGWLAVCFQMADYCDDDALKKEAVSDMSLAALLERNREGFLLSRYLFQEGKREEATRFDYEYRRLSILCGIVCEGLENTIICRPDWYGRNFDF